LQQLVRTATLGSACLLDGCSSEDYARTTYPSNA
jgi:hypothetical protein